MCFYYSKFGLPVWPLLTLNCMFGYCKYMFVLDKELRENCVAHARMNEVGFQGANVLLLGRIGLSWAELNTNITVKNNRGTAWGTQHFCWYIQ